MPPAAGRLTRGRGAEANSALAGIPLHVDDPLQGDRVAAVLGLERERGLSCARTEVGGAEGLLECISARRRDERPHDLAAVEGDLDTNPLLFSQWRPPPREPRGRNPDGRTRPPARTAPRGARR